MPNVEIAAICDVDESVLEQRLTDAEKLTKGARPDSPTCESFWRTSRSMLFRLPLRTTVTLYRRFGGCQAGMDVYVEEPSAYNIFEARLLLAAAPKYGRMVQHGTNDR
jgi:hypothetical protein